MSEGWLEVRLRFKNPDKAWKIVQTRATLSEEYESVDIFFQPKGVTWNPSEKTMRLRNVLGGIEAGRTYLIYRENTWKGRFKKEKVVLRYEGLKSLDEGISLLKSWNFEETLRYKKKGKTMEVNGTEEIFVWEDIEGLGATVEIEAFKESELDEILNEVFTGIEYSAISKTVPEMVVEALNGKNR